jgi:hypothetical protein
VTPGGESRAQLAVGTAVLAALVVAVVFVLAIWPRLSFGGGARGSRSRSPTSARCGRARR